MWDSGSNYLTSNQIHNIVTINLLASMVSVSIIMMIVFINIKIKAFFAVATIVFVILTLTTNKDSGMTIIYLFPMFSYIVYLTMFGYEKLNK